MVMVIVIAFPQTACQPHHHVNNHPSSSGWEVYNSPGACGRTHSPLTTNPLNILSLSQECHIIFRHTYPVSRIVGLVTVHETHLTKGPQATSWFITPTTFRRVPCNSQCKQGPGGSGLLQGFSMGLKISSNSAGTGQTAVLFFPINQSVHVIVQIICITYIKGN